MEVRIKHKYHLLRKMQVILTKWIFHATINQFRKVTNSFRGAAAASSASTAVSPGNPTWPAGRQVAATGFGRISPFLSVHKTFSRIDHILGYKSTLGKFKKKIEIISSIFSDHNVVRLDVNYRKKKTIKNTNIWRLNSMLLNNQQITEDIKKEINICIETNENENTTTQNLWDAVKAALRGRFIAI